MSTTHIFAARHMRHATLARANRVYPVAVSSGFSRSIPTVFAINFASLSAGGDGVLTASSTNTKATTTDTDATKSRKDSFDLVDKPLSEVANVADGSISTSIPSTAVADESDTSSNLSLSSGSIGSIVNNLDAVTEGQVQEQEQVQVKFKDPEVVESTLVDAADAQQKQQQKDSCAIESRFEEMSAAAIINCSPPASPTRSRKGFMRRLFALGKSRRRQADPLVQVSVSPPAGQPASDESTTKATKPTSSTAAAIDKEFRADRKSVAQRFVSAATRVLRLPLGVDDKRKTKATSRGASNNQGNTATTRAPGLTLSLVAGLPDVITDSFAGVMKLGRDAPSVYRFNSEHSVIAAQRSMYHSTTGMRLRQPGKSSTQVLTLSTFCNVATEAYAELADPLISVPISDTLLDMAGACSGSFRARHNDLSPQPLPSSIPTDELARTLAQDFACPSKAARRYVLEAALEHLSQLFAASTHERKTTRYDLAFFWQPAFFGLCLPHLEHDPFAMIRHVTLQAALLDRMIAEAPVFLAALAAVDNFNIVDEVVA